MQPDIELLRAWARQAGKILRDGYGKRHQVSLKGRIDLTTEIDRQSEEYLVGQIRGHFPGHAIDTEESGLLPGAPGSCWYIDPLDGTTNYTHALPLFCVSLAYAEGKDLRLGVVYDPMRDECFSAEKGKGAYLNGEPISVSETSELIRSLVVTGFPYDSRINNVPGFIHFTKLTQGVRRLGAAALDMCYVAAGRFEGYWELTLRPWDFAAAALIVQEAGGRVTNLAGGADLFQEPYPILAGNPAIHSQMVSEFQRIL